MILVRGELQRPESAVAFRYNDDLVRRVVEFTYPRVSKSRWDISVILDICCGDKVCETVLVWMLDFRSEFIFKPMF